MSLKSIINFDEKTKDSHYSTSDDVWSILSVEDDVNYQKSIELSLSGLEVDGKGIEVLTANSAVEAAAVLSSVSDISVILLDVVMESDDAGLRVVDTIRNVIGDDSVRIVLVTGQPGVNAPRQSLMKQYDIDDYWTKTDLTEEKLRSVVISNIRTWHSLSELNRAKRGLQMIVDASRVITSKLDVEEFSKTVLQEVGKIVGVPHSGGIACVLSSEHQPLETNDVVAATGSFSLSKIKTLKDALSFGNHPISKKETLALLNKARVEKHHVFGPELSVLYFSTADIDKRNYLMVVESPNFLNEQHVALLRVFCENVKTGFANLALLNKLSKLAYYDSELNIPNRNWLIRELTQSNDFMLANLDLVIINIVNFSEATVMLGSSHTELMVRARYENIRARYKHAKEICRISHNQLAILFSRINTPSVDELKSLTEQSINVDGINHTVVATVCVAELKNIIDYSASDMITIVEMALIDGLERGKAVVKYSPSFTSDVAVRHEILQDLYSALRMEDAFNIALQPKVNMCSGELVGAEALLRWTKPDGSVVPPSLFIPIAEASGIMNKIDSMVMEKTINTIKRLCSNGINMPISFNVTCSDITTTDFIEKLVGLLSASGIEPSLLEVEITESQAMEDYEEVNPVLQKLLSMGVKVSVDDFGTGYSSLAHIADLAVSTLKVDRSFVSKLSSEKCSEAGLAVCEMVFRLAKRFNFNIIAEGVETEEEKEKLIKSGYKFAQGYLFAKPMSIEDFEALCKKNA